MHRSGAVMAWNVFKFCTALRGLGSVMILLVLAIVGVTYYAVVITNYGPALFGGGRPRFRHRRRARSPLSRAGGRCVLKMDHHCVWVVNCVGALNYKYFLLFLFYTFLETTLVTVSLLSNFIAFFNDMEIPGTPGTLATTFLTFVLNLAFSLSVLGFMIMHISLVLGNTTTIEAYEKKTTPKWRYDLGRRKNFEQVFGTDKKYWFIPAYSEEDLRRMPVLQGLDYPSKPDLDAQEF
ncbi:uncharacterized protein A4U43_C01F18130 [Asparagus officinalis]|uniref:S-acyltransferase n=1 Tax=Asparagus officinalis TaxID=4686 RepID=A0A5P1FSS0_ASPOF|nr:uncharacterized protein A4U43_C01F18130 [Asparagus officinalis]